MTHSTFHPPRRRVLGPVTEFVTLPDMNGWSAWSVMTKRKFQAQAKQARLEEARETAIVRQRKAKRT